MKLDLKRLVGRSYWTRFVLWLGVFNFFDLAAMWLPIKLKAKSKKRVVFVKVEGIGDYVIWTGNFEALKQAFPSDEYERILVGSDKWKDIADGEPTFDEILFIDTDRYASIPWYRYSVNRMIRGLNADVAVNPRLTREFLWSDSLTRCSRASERIGSEGYDNLMVPAQQFISRRWYTKLIPARRYEDHEIVSNADFFRAIEPTLAGGVNKPSLLNGHSADKKPGAPYAILFVGSFQPDRCWPIGKFAKIAEHLSTNFSLEIVLCGGTGDRYLADDFASGYGRSFTNLIGSTTLHEVCKIMEGAEIVVANDTGGAHISVASGTPTIVLTPGNQVGRFFPYPAELANKGVRQISVFHEMPCFGCGYECIFKDRDRMEPKPCVADISVDDVIAAADHFLRP
jgi:ADP-heptose:LPS heptosyltransferase